MDVCPFLLIIAEFSHGELARSFCPRDLVDWINVFLYLDHFQWFRLVLEGFITLLLVRIRSSPEIIEQFGFRLWSGERANSNPIVNLAESQKAEMAARKVIPWWSSV